MLNFILQAAEPIRNPILIFSVVLFIILLAPLILGKLKIPYIIGFILAGLVIGPNGLNILARDSSFELFGNVGLLYIMFLAGLDMDLNDIRKNTAKSLTFGAYTFSIPMILGTLSGIILIGFITTQHYDVNAIVWTNGYNLKKYLCLSSVLLASMYASHTLITYPIVSRFGISKKSYVNITIGGTIITTTLALFILAVIVGLSKGNMDQRFWIKLGISITLFCLIVFLLFPIIARWFLKKYNDSVLQYIFVLAMVFLASFLAQKAQIEAIIGAFFAGMTLNRLIPKVSPLMNRIEFVGNALFIPYFLIGVGMLINLRVLFDGVNTLIAAVTMSFIATFSKFMAAYLTQKTFKMSTDERQIIFGLSNSQAAATLAAVIIGYNIQMGVTPDGEPIRLLNEEILNGTIIMILITCTISSFVTEKTASRLALADESEEPEEETFDIEKKRILVPVSQPENVDNLVELAVLLKGEKDNEPLYFTTITDDNNPQSKKVVTGKKILEQAAKTASSVDIYVEKLLRFDINVANGISNLVHEYNITELILGLHSQSKPNDPFFGEKTCNLLKNVLNTIFIYKSVQPINTIKKIMVAIPEKAEYEVGFVSWFLKIKLLAKELGANIEFYAHKETVKKLKLLVEREKMNYASFFELSDWDDFLILSKDVEKDDLFIIVCARKGTLSYNPLFEKLPSQLSKYFDKNSFIIVYPEQLGSDSNDSHWSLSQ